MVSENSVLAGNAEVMILVEIMLASTMNAVFVAFFALVISCGSSKPHVPFPKGVLHVSRLDGLHHRYAAAA